MFIFGVVVFIDLDFLCSTLILQVKSDDAVKMARRLALEEGLMVINYSITKTTDFTTHYFEHQFDF